MAPCARSRTAESISVRIFTRPRSPRTSRTMSELRPRGGMKSMSVTDAVAGLHLRFEDQRVAAIAAADAGVRAGGFNQPASVLGRAEQRGEARGGIEARPTEPINRTGARHQRGRFAVSNQRVIFERGAHQQVDGNVSGRRPREPWRSSQARSGPSADHWPVFL